MFSGYLRSASPMLALVIAASIATALFTVGLFALVFQVISGRYSGSLPWPSIFVCLSFLVLSARTTSAIVLELLSSRSTAQLRLQFAEVVLAAPLPHVEAVGNSRLLTALTTDVTIVSSAVPRLVQFCSSAATSVALVFYATWLSPVGGGIVLAAMCVGLPAHWLFMRRVTRLSHEAGRAWDRFYRNFDALVSGLKQLKLNSLRREQFMSVEFSQRQSEFLEIKSRAHFANVLASNCAQILFLGILGYVLSFLLHQNHADAGFVFAIIYLIGPLESVLSSTASLAEANAAYRRIQELEMAVPPVEAELTSSTAERSDTLTWRQLTLRQVFYVYPGANGFSFGPVDLALNRGEIVFITGGNGSGKSTFAKLLAGLYVPRRGEIVLDDMMINESRLANYRQQFSSVFEDAYLFERAWSRTQDAGEIERHLKAWGLSGTVKLNDGYFSTTTALSRGQKKRLALLSALLEDRAIYIFDEWAADQDALSRNYFYETLLPSLKQAGKLVVVLTHDQGFDRIADRICRFQDGKLLSRVPETA